MDKNLFKKQKRKEAVTIMKNDKPSGAGIKKRYIKHGQLCKVTFIIPKQVANDAKTVNVVGDFNNWDKDANPLKKLRTGNFSTTLELACGRSYRFKYLIDDSRWENDRHADHYVSNPYGGDDSVVSL